MKPSEIKAQVEPIYIELLGQDGFEGLDVRVGPDHAGEPAVFIGAKVKGDVDDALERKISAVKSRIFDLFREREDERFPYIWMSFDDPDGVAMDEARVRRRRAR
jgi:hypothetical protein